MALDRALIRFGSAIEEGTAWPRPMCPECSAGHLRFGDPVEMEDGTSKQMRDHPAWEPEWIRGVFTASATCENPECEQPATAVGTYTVDVSQARVDEHFQRLDYSKYYAVSQIHPAPALMRLPESTPSPVQEGVERAAAVLLTDPGLAATALRLVVEQFLSSEGIPATRDSGGFISADHRIKTWKRASPDRERIADLFLAAKWIGNAGTHSLSTLSVKEVLDGAEFLDEAFHALFVGPDVYARAQAVNAARGPLPRTER